MDAPNLDGFRSSKMITLFLGFNLNLCTLCQANMLHVSTSRDDFPRDLTKISADWMSRAPFQELEVS